MRSKPEHIRHRTANPDFAEYAFVFADTIFDPDRPEPDCVSGPNGKPATKRFNVYRNNVVVSLIDALADIYPATQRIVGKKFFREMARLHVRATPPVSRLLFEYGRDFPDFIYNFEHTANLPWLGDVARIERAWLDAYHAADASPLRPELLSSTDTEKLGDMRFYTHPATRIVRSDFPAVTIFSANRKTEPFKAIEASGPEDALITRPELDTFVRRLPPGGAEFLNCLMDGNTLSEASESGARKSAMFDLSANIRGMLEAGAFTQIVP